MATSAAGSSSCSPSTAAAHSPRPTALRCAGELHRALQAACASGRAWCGKGPALYEDRGYTAVAERLIAQLHVFVLPDVMSNALQLPTLLPYRMHKRTVSPKGGGLNDSSLGAPSRGGLCG